MSGLMTFYAFCLVGIFFIILAYFCDQVKISNSLKNQQNNLLNDISSRMHESNGLKYEANRLSHESNTFQYALLEEKGNGSENIEKMMNNFEQEKVKPPKSDDYKEVPTSKWNLSFFKK